jgi:hypothetical protein
MCVCVGDEKETLNINLHFIYDTRKLHAVHVLREEREMAHRAKVEGEG